MRHMKCVRFERVIKVGKKRKEGTLSMEIGKSMRERQHEGKGEIVINRGIEEEMTEGLRKS